MTNGYYRVADGEDRDNLVGLVNDVVDEDEGMLLTMTCRINSFTLQGSLFVACAALVEWIHDCDLGCTHHGSV